MSADRPGNLDRASGLLREPIVAGAELRKLAGSQLTRRELDVIASLCRPAASDEAFAAPATAHEVAADLGVTDAAIKQHLIRLYQKFRIPEGPNRRTRLANEVMALGLVRPMPLAEPGEVSGVSVRPRVQRLPLSAAGLLAVADRLLPAADRIRYAEEYRSELTELAQSGVGRWKQVQYALSQLRSAPEMRFVLRSQRRQGAPS